MQTEDSHERNRPPTPGKRDDRDCRTPTSLEEIEELRASNRLLRAVIDGIPDTLVVIDRQYRVILANRAARDWAGGVDPISHPVRCFQYSHQRNTPCSCEHCTCPLEQAVASRLPVTVEHDHVGMGGTNAPVEVVAAPICNDAGEVEYLIESCRDISRRKEAERELARYRDRLEELVEERSRELEQSKERLRRAEQLASMGTFAAGIAHEINNPLASILMTARHALRSRRDIHAVETLLREIIADTERCARIVKGVLRFARQGPAEKWDVDLNEITVRAAEAARKYADRSGVHLSVDLEEEALPIVANPIDLEQALVNVLNNAIEASPARQTVVLMSERTEEYAVVRIQDHGKGMTAGTRQRVFDPFFTTRTREGGTGLGLSIVHGTVTDHAGVIHIESQPHQGTIFAIELPLRRESP